MKLKRYAMPRLWRIERKKYQFVTRPIPGPHSKERCLPLQIILRDILHFAETGKEAKKILAEGKVLVDKKIRKNPSYPVGLMDIIEIPEIKKSFVVNIGKKGLFLEEIKEEQNDKKLCKIKNIKNVKGGLFQLNLHDGRNLLVKEKTYKVNDSILIKLPKQKILKHFKFVVGEIATIIAGRNMGVSGKIKEIDKRKNMLEKSRVVIKTKDKDIETALKYVMVGKL